MVQRTEHLTAIIEREGDGYVALCPELDIASQGDSVEGASANLREALSLFLESAGSSELKDRLHKEASSSAEVHGLFDTPLDP